MRFPHAIVVAAAVSMACAGVASPLRADGTRILFIGNSLTATNGLPAMVEAIGASAGERVECTSVVYPDFSLEDHWTRGDARRAIQRGGWSFVVLQQGPSARPDSRVLLRDYVQRFHREIIAAGGRTAIYMVWPPKVRAEDFDEVSRSYALAAADVHGTLLPVGDAWRDAWRDDPSLALYGPDGFHPSPLGSYLAALVIHNRLTARPIGSPPTQLTSTAGTFPKIALTPRAAAILGRAAGRADAPR